MAGVIRRQVLDRVFGSGASGVVGAAMVGWLIDQLKERNDPELLDTAHLVPGETYTISTRPAPTRAERKVEQRVAASSRKLDKVTPSPKATKSASKKVQRAAQRLDRATPGTRKAAKRAVQLDHSAATLAKLTTPSAKQLKLQAALDLHVAELARRRDEALSAARKKHQRPVRREFR